MVRQETIKRIMEYVRKRPDLDPHLVGEGLFIFHLHREIEILAETLAAKLCGLSSRQMDTLEVLFHKQDEAITPAQLAEEVHLTRSAMTSNLDVLARKEYISREAHPSDRRMIIITLTPKGIEFCEEIMPVKYQNMCRVMKGLSKGARETLREVYIQIMKILGEIEAEVSS